MRQKLHLISIAPEKSESHVLNGCNFIAAKHISSNCITSAVFNCKKVLDTDTGVLTKVKHISYLIFERVHQKWRYVDLL